MKLRRLLPFLLLWILPFNSHAVQFTFTDYEFFGIPCFPGSSSDWCFEVVAGEGIEIIEVNDLGWGYEINYEMSIDEGYIHCTLSDWSITGLSAPNLGVDFLIHVWDGIWPYHEFILPDTFCDYHGPVVQATRVVDDMLLIFWDTYPCAMDYRIESSSSLYGPFETENTGTIEDCYWITPLLPGQKFYRVIAIGEPW